MYKYLEKIKSPSDIKQLTTAQLNVLASEIRHFLITSISKTGGHLSSNLGVVELTIALFKTFNLPDDKIIWDVGHQAYVHKLLTGRMEDFPTIRSLGGISGFPKICESEFDSYNSGHASTSISAALGMERAGDILGDDRYIIPVIGDGALTGGLAYEALNDAGCRKKNFIVILNDNAMSISRNVGSIARILTKLRTKPNYFKLKADIEEKLTNVGKIGSGTVRGMKRIKDSVRYILTDRTIFEEFGFTYLGPIDGHDIDTLSMVLERAKHINNPVLIHILTKKGKGYNFAEKRPEQFHGISRFSIETGLPSKDTSQFDYSKICGNKICELAMSNKKLCAISAAMPLGTGMDCFAQKFPSRFFDVGIAEQHAVTLSAGLALKGLTPVVAVYSSFLQRAYDQIIQDVCLQNLHVVFCIDRAGLVGEDGETHQGMFDLAYLSPLPNMTVLAPSNFSELEQMLVYAVNEHKGPIAIRYPRGCQNYVYPCASDFKIFKSDIIKESNKSDVCIMCVGTMTKTGFEVIEKLNKNGISASLVNLRTVVPLDEKMLENAADNHSLLVTVEDGVMRGGIGEAIAAKLFELNKFKTPLLIKAHKNAIVQHGNVNELYKLCGLDSQSIADEIIKRLKDVPVDEKG